MEKFVTYDGKWYIRVSAIVEFGVIGDSTYIRDTQDNTHRYIDPDRTLYRKLCADLGVEPVGVEA